MVSAVTHDEINVSFDSFLLKNLAQKSYFSTVKYIYIVNDNDLFTLSSLCTITRMMNFEIIRYLKIFY